MKHYDSNVHKESVNKCIISKIKLQQEAFVLPVSKYCIMTTFPQSNTFYKNSSRFSVIYVQNMAC